MSIGRLCPIQSALMKEKLLLVNMRDEVLGSATKEQAHLMDNIKTGKMLHRAFSLFIFNSDNELMMQRRAPTKITFPGLYTNSCCSHPLSTIQGETEGAAGVISAAVRRVEDELGITELNQEDIQHMTRIVYYGPSSEQWGEHELDHVLIAKKEVPFAANPNEVSEVLFLKRKDLDDFLCDKKKYPVTPWFDIIANSMLKTWWDNLDNLQNIKDDKIHFFSSPSDKE